MARKRKKEFSGGASWMETYSDLVTLLLTFFVMLYSMSTIDAQKYAMIVEAFSKGNAVIVQKDKSEEVDDNGLNMVDIEGDGINPVAGEKNNSAEKLDDEAIDELYNLLMEYAKKENISDSIQVSKSEEYVFIRFSDDITFGGYSNKLSDRGIKILDVLAYGLKLVDEYIEEVIIAGHTAEVVNDNTTIDRSLSTERANAVLKYLEEKHVIDPAKYLAIGYGLYTPIADNSTPDGRAKNRRVEIYISRKGYPVSYTNIIKNAVNKNDMKEESSTDINDDISYENNSIVN